MKKISRFALMTFLSVSPLLANAGEIETRERTIRDRTTPSTVKLNSESVRCSDIGYGNLQLKVTVPVLARVAFLNHANIGESLPCITAGRCAFDDADTGHRPSEILKDGAPESEDLQIHVVLKEVFTLDHKNKTCVHGLRETVDSNIRGVQFNHLRTGDLGQFPYELCTQI